MAQPQKPQRQSLRASRRPRTSPHTRSASASPQGYRLGQHVQARIMAVADFGLSVELEDGSRGFIRRKELSWDENVRPQLILRAGDTIEALVLEVDAETQRWELSYRWAIRDPWQEFLGTYHKGAVLKGRVKRLLPGGVFVEIIPGVDGWLPISQVGLAAEAIEGIDQVLWLGDDVEAVITEIDSKRRRVGLSLRDRLQQISHGEIQQKLREYSSRQGIGPTIGERTGISAEALKARLFGREGKEPGEGAEGMGGWRLSRPLKVLVVDDEASVRDPMAERLRLWGCECASASNGQEAYQLASGGNYDLIFMDIGLPDINGSAIAQQILEHKPAAQIVMTSGVVLAENYTSELESLSLAGVLLKPLDVAEIQDLLETVARRESSLRFSYAAANQGELAAEVDFFRAISLKGDPFATLDATLAASLAEIRKATHAQVAAVFSMDLSTHSATIVAQEGQVELTYNPAHHPLEISPVKDVIVDHEHIYLNDIHTRAAAKFKYLLPLLDFNSFIGIPVEVGGEIRHGLFLFHESDEAFSTVDFQRALAASVVLGATLERIRLDQTMLKSQNLLLQGQLSAGLAHEINNKLSGITLKAENLADRCQLLESRLTDLSLSRSIATVRSELAQIAELSSTLRQTARLFQTLMQAKPQDLTDVNQVIRIAMEIVLPMARKNKVELKSRLDSNIPKVSAVGARLEQAFLNIMINGIQQIAAYSPSGGVLEVVVSYDAGDHNWPVKIHFRDDGPGIHRQLFEKIFTLGFTTRHKGSGLGLYITKGLIESVGGRIMVEESVMLVGTTFLVELPAAS